MDSGSRRCFFWTVFLGALSTAAGWAPLSANADALEEVVVTAQKRDQRVQDLPITMTVLSGTLLAASDAKDLTQVANYVPGMVFSRAPDDGLALTFRGVGSPARSQAFDQSVAVFLDGLFLAKNRLYTQALFDIDQIEFTKGTQSSVLGKNASVGAIGIVSREPGSTASGDLRGSDELQHGGAILDGGIDIPLNSEAALRVAGHYNDTNGWVRNTATGRDVPIDRDGGIRATGLWRLGDGSEAKLSYQHSQDLRIGVPYQIVDAHLPTAFGEGVFNDTESELTNRTVNRETTHRTDSDFVNLKVTRPFGSMTLVSQSGFLHFHLDFDDDFDFSVAPWIDFIRNETYSQESEEVRLLSPGGERAEWLAGVFVFFNQWHSVEQQLWAVPGFPPGSPIAGQLYNGPFINDFRQNTNNESTFGQWKWHWTNDIQTTLGVRATHEGKAVEYGRSNSAPFTIWNTVANPPFPVTPLRFDDTFVDGNASLERRLTDRASAYFAYGHGTKTGGFVETNSVPSANPAVDARIGTETTNTVEVGVKSLWLGDTLKFNAALFDMRVKDFQNTLFTGTAFVTENLPLRSKGVDLDTEWQVARRLRLSAGTTYSDAVESPTATDRLAGSRCNPCQASQAPRWNGSASLQFRDSLIGSMDWTASLHVRSRSRMFNQPGEAFATSSFTPVDIGLGVVAKSGAYGVEVLGKNIFNRLTEDFSSPSVAPYFASLASPAPLRQVYLTFWLKFSP